MESVIILWHCSAVKPSAVMAKKKSSVMCAAHASRSFSFSNSVMMMPAHSANRPAQIVPDRDDVAGRKNVGCRQVRRRDYPRKFIDNHAVITLERLCDPVERRGSSMPVAWLKASCCYVESAISSSTVSL
jgi:hypothetical protein